MIRANPVCVCGLTILTLAAGAGDAQVLGREFPPEDLRLVAAAVREGAVLLDECFDQGDATTIALEAEDALGLVAEPAQGMESEHCSGGRCVVKLDRALFPVHVTRPGRYQRWSRALFPHAGTWVHSESLNFGPPQWIRDFEGATGQDWVWVKGPVYDLAAGTHLLWLHNWHGGARLDRLLLAPEGAPAPEGLGPPAIPRSPAREGWALTPALGVAGLARIGAVEWPHQTRGGAVEVSLSTDGGRTFRAIPDDGMPTLDEERAGMAQIVLKASLTRAPDGTSPVLGAPRVTYEVDPEAFVSLENDHLRATFLRATGGLVGLLSKAPAEECLAGADGRPPFELRHLPPGAEAPVAITPDSARLTSLDAEPDRLHARYRIAGGVAAELTVALRGPELAFTLDVDNQSDLDIVEVICPHIPGVRLGERSQDDILITPNWQGGLKTLDPVRSGGGSVPYPAGGAMAWLDLYEETPAHGLYLASHDEAVMGCRLSATPQPDMDGLTFGVLKYARVRPGGRWTTPPAVIGVHEGAWHAAADAYRAWADTWLRKPNPPEWVREADGWYGLVVSAESNNVPFRRIPQYLQAMRELGTSYIQVWGQMTGGTNCDSLPFPNPVLGSVDEFREAIREVQRWGGHITFYVSSQFWKVDYGEGEMIGSTPRALLPASVPTWSWDEWRNYMIRSYAGGFSGDTSLSEADRDKYGTPVRRVVPCPFTDAWADRHLHYWCVQQYGEQYGADGIYLDETVAAGERYCFDDRHGHQHHGIWGASLARSMERMVADGRRRDPHWMFAMEGCSDVVGQFADVHLISPASARRAGLWGANKIWAPEVFRYTFPDYTLYDGVANGVYGIPSDQVFLNVHLHGNRFDAFSVQPAAPFVALRQRTKQLLYRARFMDDLGVTTADPTVQAKLNVLQDEHSDVRLVNIANPEEKPGVEIALDLPGAEAPFAFFFDLDGGQGPLPGVVRDGVFRFTAPAAKASTVLVGTRCEPLVRAPVQDCLPGGDTDFEVILTNPSRAPVRGRLSLEGPWLGAATPTAEVALGAGETRAVPLRIQAPGDQPLGSVRGHVRFEGDGFSVRRPAELLVRSPFEVTANLRATTVHVTVTNRSASAHEGVLTVSGPAWETALEWPLDVEGEGHMTVEAPLADVPREPVEMTVRLVSAGLSETRALAVRPLLINGGFERVVDGRPWGWSYQNPQLVSACTEAPAEGAVALRLTGEPGKFLEGNQLLALEQGRSYEARCKLRRTPGAARVLGPCIVLSLHAGGERYVHLKKATDAPDDVWNEYAATFTVTDDVRDVRFYLYNVDSEATAWYDDARVRETDE